MPPPRVLQIGKHFHPDVGGIETVTKNISDALWTSSGISADVLCMAFRSSSDRQEVGYRVIRSPSELVLAGNKTVSRDYFGKVRALSPHYDVGILHVPNPLGALAALVGWKKPLVLLWHADFDHRVLGALTRPLDIAIARRADAIVAPTQVHFAASNRARHLLVKGEVIPFPFAPLAVATGSAPSPLIARIRDAARGRPVILAAGRLVVYKGFDVLVQAMALLGAEAFCVIAGGGPREEAIKAQVAALGLADRVVVTGQIADAEMAELVDLAHFGCLPSVTAQEMYGLTQVEMMAAGKPVVSTDLVGSGVPLINRPGETGLLARPGDAGDLARQITALLKDAALYRQLADGAGKAFNEEYSLDPVGRQYAALVERLMGPD